MLNKFWKFYTKQDKPIFFSNIFALIFSALVFIIFFINRPNLPSQLPLFYSLPWGDNYLADLNQFLTLPFISVLIILLNIIISWHLHKSQSLLKRILSFCSLAITILTLITAVKIIYIFI